MTSTPLTEKKFLSYIILDTTESICIQYIYIGKCEQEHLYQSSYCTSLSKCTHFLQQRPRHAIYIHTYTHLYTPHPMSIIVQRDATRYSLLYFCKLLYMFRVLLPPIIRSTQTTVTTAFGTGRPYLLPSAVMLCTTVEGSRYGWPVPDAVVKVVCVTWWWVEVTHEICGAVYRDIINCI